MPPFHHHAVNQAPEEVWWLSATASPCRRIGYGRLHGRATALRSWILCFIEARLSKAFIEPTQLEQLSTKNAEYHCSARAPQRILQRSPETPAENPAKKPQSTTAPTPRKSCKEPCREPERQICRRARPLQQVLDWVLCQVLLCFAMNARLARPRARREPDFDPKCTPRFRGQTNHEPQRKSPRRRINNLLAQCWTIHLFVCHAIG